jgi:hypothetical protein
MLRQYANQGSFQDVVVKMFSVNSVYNFQILIVFFTLTCEFNSLLNVGIFSFVRRS